MRTAAGLEDPVVPVPGTSGGRGVPVAPGWPPAGDGHLSLTYEGNGKCTSVNTLVKTWAEGQALNHRLKDSFIRRSRPARQRRAGVPSPCRWPVCHAWS